LKENNKKIVVYYSYTNHTKMIAKRLKEKLNCDILEIEPQKPYSTDYNLVVDEEQNNSSDKKIPAIKKIGINLDEYDTIILGTPVWWYTITPPIRTFLTKNDLSGKTIIPFATNAGWLGSTFKEIKELCPNSKIENEMNIVFGEDYHDTEPITDKEEIDEWISKL
jgi:flavodoxin